MNIKEIIRKVPKVFQKPPSVVARRVYMEIHSIFLRHSDARLKRQFSISNLLTKTECHNFDMLWSRVVSTPNITPGQNIDSNRELFGVSDPDYFNQSVERAMQNKIDLLGTGLMSLGENIDWIQDYKTGVRWPNQYAKDIEYSNLDRSSDVKIPWEISRLNWLIPVAQQYMLTKDEQYAKKIKDILLSWIEGNPYAHSVNWSCTMEVAMRIIIWSFLFHACKESKEWQCQTFREKFLCSLYLHVYFASNNLEYSDVNGNHYTADAAGLVFGGLFFKDCAIGKKWHVQGWHILEKEIFLQVHDDGADFEGSIPYHRLVTELFFLPAMLREANGFQTPEHYKKRVIAMGYFIAAYSRQDGSVPLLGDADDARTLPMSMRVINDHRYLIGMIALQWNNQALQSYFSGPIDELIWFYSGKKVGGLQGVSKQNTGSVGFKTSGYFIMRNAKDHVFIDCADVGQRGRGGHGHNDCLSLTLFLNDTLLIEDSGSFLYTASPKDRNFFRSTVSHNTPFIDNIEINSFYGPLVLWTLKNDAKPKLIKWANSVDKCEFIGSHSGYEKLDHPVVPKRKIQLNHLEHSIIIEDIFEGKGQHEVVIPYHLAIGVTASVEKNYIVLRANGKKFILTYQSENQWDVNISQGRGSQSYGVVDHAQVVVFSRSGSLSSITVKIRTETT